MIGNVGDRNDLARRQWTAKGAPHLASITEHRDVVVVPDFLGFGATNNKIVQRVVHHFSNESAFFRAESPLNGSDIEAD